MRKIRFTSPLFIGIILFFSPALYAQEYTKVLDQNRELLRRDLRAGKKQLIAANIDLSDTEVNQFWPIYDRYAVEATKIYDVQLSVIKEYAENFGKLTDAQAESLARRYVDADEAAVKLRQEYLAIFSRVIGGKKTARFIQVDRRLALIIDLQLASEIPLVQSK